MGQKYTIDLPPETPQDAAPQSFLDRLGGVRGVIAGGVRGLSGLLSAEGGWPGAAISGLGETGAEMVEGSPLSPARIGTEAGIGAVPFGKIFKAGRPVASAIKGALYGGTSSLIRQKASGQDLDPKAALTNAAISGLVGGGLAKALAPAAAPAAERELFQVEPTIRPGGMTLGSGGKVEQSANTPRGIRATNPAADQAKLLEQQKQNMLSTVNRIGAEREARGYQPAPVPDAPLSTPSPGPYGRVPIVGTPAEASTRVQRVITKETKAAEMAQRAADREAAKQAKLDAQGAAAAKIEAAREAAGVEAQAPRFSDSISAPNPEGGTQRMSTSYKAPKPGGEVDELTNLLSPEAKGGAVPEASAPIVQEPAPPQEPLGPPPSTPAPTARYAFDWPEAGGPQYNVEGGALHGSTVGADTVAREGLPIAEGPVNNPAIQREGLAKLFGAGEEKAPVPPVPPPSTPLPQGTPEQVLSSQLSPYGEGALMSNGVRPTELDLGGRGFDEPHIPTPPPTPSVPPTPPAPQEGVLAKFFKTKGGATGYNYRLAKDAEHAGEIPTAEYARAARLREVEAEKAQKAATASPAVEPAPPSDYSPQDLAGFKEQGGKLDELKALLDRVNSQKGEINPMIAARLGMGAAGAAIGGATDPLDNRWASAAAGGAIGAATPSAIQSLAHLGVPESALHASGVFDMPKTAEGIKAAAEKIFHMLPQVQRFNYLTDMSGLPANTLFGPYGSALMAGIEHGLNGDPRGWEVVRNLNPAKFVQSTGKSLAEASHLIGRAEGQAMSDVPSLTEKTIALPGTMMTAGDVAARKVLEAAGYSPEEARVITLTSEPQTALGKNVVRFGKARTEGGKDSSLAQLLLPFKRTTMNIAEQGAKRTPGLGFLAQRAFDNPDPLKTQLIQQGLGTVVGGANAALASNLDPDTAKWVRKYTTNIGGQYALPAALGFAAGQAMSNGKSATSGMIHEGAQALPLPTTTPITEWAKFLSGEGPAPRGSYPSFLKKDNPIEVLGAGAAALAGGATSGGSTVNQGPDTPEGLPTFILRRP